MWGVRDDHVVAWAEIVTGDEHRARTAGGTPEEQLLRARLERIADLARRVVDRARLNPQAPVSGTFLADVVTLIEDAEG